MKRKKWNEYNMRPERVAYRKEYYKKYWKTHPNPYKRKGTKAGFKIGHIVSVETRNKLRLASLGKKKGEYTLERRRHMSEAHLKIREKSHLWRGGIASQTVQRRNLWEYKLWRETVFKRDNWTCQSCKKRSKVGERVFLHAHHIKPFSLFPEFSFNIDNGITLCKSCHSRTPSYLNRYNNRSEYVKI